MFTIIAISIITIVLMMVCIIKFPKIKIKNFSIDTFWIIPLISAIIILAFGLLDFSTAISGLTSSSSINPIKILVLFFSMTFLSIVLDELGFFEVLANIALKKVKQSQFALFFILYAIKNCNRLGCSFNFVKVDV